MSTDLFGRGIDIERVNIVINYDFPETKTEGNQNSAGSDQVNERGQLHEWREPRLFSSFFFSCLCLSWPPPAFIPPP